MLEHLELRDVGPTSSLRLSFAPRLNVFAGGNGLGKTFVLDAAFWALTGSWAGLPAAPRRGAGTSARIACTSHGTGGRREIESIFDSAEQEWKRPPPRTSGAPGLVLYVRGDGGFSLWDDLRAPGDYSAASSRRDRAPSFQFTASEVFDGITTEGPEPSVVCNGLIRDWVLWQLQRNAAFETLTRVLEGLSPRPGETLRMGPATTRLSVRDVREIPTLDFGYGPVAVVHASTGIRRILSLAYLLVWALREHAVAADLKNAAPAQSLLVLIDEVEAHLHPEWQFVVVPALLRALRDLEPTLDVQMIATTHAPHVIASVAPLFDECRDALFHFELDDRRISVAKLPWALRGDASSWLAMKLPSPFLGRSVPR